jgi:hypothetical protein
MLRSVLLAIAGANLRRKVDQLRRAALFYTLAGAAFVLGLVFLLIAAYIFFAERYGALPAALGFAGGLIVLALLILAIHSLGGSRPSPRLEKEERADQMKAMATAVAIGAVPAIIRSTGIVGALVLPAIAVVGYAIYKENKAPPPPRGDL